MVSLCHSSHQIDTFDVQLKPYGNVKAGRESSASLIGNVTSLSLITPARFLINVHHAYRFLYMCNSSLRREESQLVGGGEG